MSHKTPRVEEFERFIEVLMGEAPEGYEPYLLVLNKNSKAPKSGESWSEGGPITVEKAKQWMEHGFNIGIAGRHGDELVMLDLDEPDEWGPSDIPDTLIAKSRSRTGYHAYAWADEQQLRVENMSDGRGGGVRSAWQYAVAPGSYVPVDDSEVPDDANPDDVGYYSVEKSESVASVTLDDLSDEMRPEWAVKSHDTVKVSRGESDVDPDVSNPLFELTTTEVVEALGGDASGERFGHDDLLDGYPGHSKPSSTGANMSVKWDMLHCWRCGVTHSGFQVLVMYGDNGYGQFEEFDGFSTVCEAVGCAHGLPPGESDSVVVENNEALWCAFHGAKELDLLDESDPIPARAVRGFMKRRGIKGWDDDVLSDRAWNFALSMIEDYEPISCGREIEREKVPDVW